MSVMLTGWTVLFLCPDHGRQVKVPGAGHHAPAGSAAHDGQPGQEVGHRLLLLSGLY